MALDMAKSSDMQVHDPNNPVPVVSTSQTNNATAINWNDYNFPPCLHLVHFSLGELQGSVKRFVLKVYLSYMIVLSVLLINCKFVS